MHVEHVAGVRLAARRAAKHQRHLAVGGGLLGQVVVHAERGLALLVHEVLGERAAGVRREELQRRRVGGRGDDHDGVLDRAGLPEPLHHRRHRRLLLADGDVHADDAGALLVDDRVDRDGGLAGAAVADDQLALATADRDHGVDGLDAGLQRLVDRLPHDDAGRDDLDRPAGLRLDRAQAVDRLAERIHHATEHLRAGRHLEQAAGAADLVAFLQHEVVADDGGADRVLVQVEHQGDDGLARLPRGDLEHLVGHRRLEAVDAGDAVGHAEHRTNLGVLRRRQVGRRDFLEEDFLELAGAEECLRGHEIRWK